jgi:hypothetical protein
MANGFQLWAERVHVMRRISGKRDRDWEASIIMDGDHGIIEAGTELAVGDEVYNYDFFGRTKNPSRTVAAIDWESLVKLKRGVVTWASPILTRRAQLGATVDLDLDLHGLLLLDWLYTQNSDDRQFAIVGDFVTAQNLPDNSDRLLAQHLKLRGFVESPALMGGPAFAMLTTEGINYIQKIRAKRVDHAERIRTLRQALLTWLYSQERQGIATGDWNGFVNGPDAHFYGDPFTETDIVTAVGDLSAKNLISGIDIDQLGPAMVKPRLTVDGRSCVIDYESDVSEYLKRQQGGSTNITMTNVQGQTVIASDNVTQTMTTGVDVSKLLDFAGFVRQVAPTLGLDEADQADLRNQAEQLHDAASSSNPDRGRLRRLLDAVMQGLLKAAPSVVTTAANDMGHEAIKAITGG